MTLPAVRQNGAVHALLTAPDSLRRTLMPAFLLALGLLLGAVAPLWQYPGAPATVSTASTVSRSAQYIHDPIGNVTGLVGFIAQTPTIGYSRAFAYDAYGNILQEQLGQVSAGGQPFLTTLSMGAGVPSSGVRYKGELFDAPINQTYMRNRQYEPVYGRFAQVDPARAGGNWYSGFGGNPVNRSDPTGLDWEWQSPNGVEANGGGYWKFIEGTDPTVPRPLRDFTPDDNGGSSTFTQSNVEGLLGFYLRQGSADPTKTKRYRDEATAIGNWYGFLGQLGDDQVLQLRVAMRDREEMIGALQRLNDKLQNGQTTDDRFAAAMDFFNPAKTPAGAAMYAAGVLTAPIEEPLLALSAPGVINSPVAPVRGAGAAAAILGRLPALLRSTRVVAAVEELAVSADLQAASRPTVLKQYESLPDPGVAGTFTPNVPLMLQRSGLLGRLGLQSPVFTGGTIKIRPGLSAADEAEVLAHEEAHALFAFRYPELRYLQSSSVPGVRGISAFIDELQAYRAGLGGGFHPGRAWSSLSGAERFSLVATPVTTATGIYGLYDYFMSP